MIDAVDTMMRKAVALHRAGRLEAALAGYDEVLRSCPGRAGALAARRSRRENFGLILARAACSMGMVNARQTLASPRASIAARRREP